MTTRGILLELCMAFLTFTLVATAQMPSTTKSSIPGQVTVHTETLSGTVVAIEGNHLAVRMSTGEMRTFDVKSGARATVDGKEIGIEDLKVGTELTATYTTTTTPITDRTVTVGTGRVWHVQGSTVILTLPNGENRMYKVKDDYKFTIEGNKKATVFDLRKGMVISAEKIVEEPRTEIASNRKVTGTAPPPPQPRTEAVQAQSITPPPVPESEATAAKATAPPVERAPAKSTEQAKASPGSTPAALPIEPAQTVPAEEARTGGLVLLGGLTLLLIGVFGFRRLRRS